MARSASKTIPSFQSRLVASEKNILLINAKSTKVESKAKGISFQTVLDLTLMSVIIAVIPSIKSTA